MTGSDGQLPDGKDRRERMRMAISITVVGLAGSVILSVVGLFIALVPLGEITPLALEFAKAMGAIGVVGTAVLALSALVLPHKPVSDDA